MKLRNFNIFMYEIVDKLLSYRFKSLGTLFIPKVVDEIVPVYVLLFRVGFIQINQHQA